MKTVKICANQRNLMLVKGKLSLPNAVSFRAQREISKTQAACSPGRFKTGCVIGVLRCAQNNMVHQAADQHIISVICGYDFEKIFAHPRNPRFRF